MQKIFQSAGNGIATFVLCWMLLIPQAVDAKLPKSGDFSDLAEDLLPTVVNVATTQDFENMNRQMMPEFPPGSPFEDFFKDFFEKHQNTPQMPQRRPSSLGSGFVIDAEQGYIVTNNHVIKDAVEIKVILHDDSTVDAELVGSDEKTDVAVLKIKTDKKLVAAKWGDSGKLRVGNWVLAIGNPFGLGGTVTAGIVSARQRDINAGPYDDFIQTDASINRGNSGGPMFNTDGEVIGINTAIFSPSGGSVGIGFAVPSNLARPVVEQLVKYGQTRRGWLGVRIQAVDEGIADSLGLKEPKGALVASATPDGPAEKSGILPGDVILTFDGKDVPLMRSLPRIVAETEVGKEVKVEVWRNGKKETVDVTLGQLETAEESGLLASNEDTGETTDTTKNATEIEELGLSLMPLNGALRKKFEVEDDADGVLVVGVANGSPAAEKGLLPGDVIEEVDQEDVTEPAQVVELVQKAVADKRKLVLVYVNRRGDMRFSGLKLKTEKDEK